MESCTLSAYHLTSISQDSIRGCIREGELRSPIDTRKALMHKDKCYIDFMHVRNKENTDQPALSDPDPRCPLKE